MVPQTATADRHVTDVLDMTMQMEAFAADGEWQQVEELAEKLKNAVLAVPRARRRAVVVAARRSMNNVRTLAEQERASVADKLSQIHRGRDATRAYGSTAASPFPGSASDSIGVSKSK